MTSHEAKSDMRHFMRLVNKLAHGEDLHPDDLAMVRQHSGIFNNQEANGQDCVLGEHFAIKFQTGPVGEELRDENGGLIKQAGEVNGCQIEDLLDVALQRLRRFNGMESGGREVDLWPGVKPVPCRENAIAITKVEEAILWLQRRTENRKRQGVEGTHLSHRA